jgi:hypothetical protein
MTAMGKVGVLSLLAALCACATPAEKQMFALSLAASEQLKSCSAAIYAAPEAAPVRAHLPEKLMDAPEEEVLPTAEEARAFAVMEQQSHRCRSAFLERLARSVPLYVPVYVELFEKNDAVAADLIGRKITWAEYVRRLKQNRPAFETQYDVASKRLSSGLSPEEDFASRQRAADAVRSYEQGY